ncbi:hypothetical protein [Nitratireductor sp. GCM10026969]|uniref:hypothetical protein n=1 Tax=Nitratireductor sp. GCM10026969 TaxID=3252645 RepID=UPI00361CA5BD
MNPLQQQQFAIEPQPNPLRDAFLKWQCRVRQIAMRDNEGRPDAGIMPAVYLPGEPEPMSYIITILNKAPVHSATPELEHMSAKTNDPARRRDQAVEYLSASYYQKASEFSDMLTATFPAHSPGAAAIHTAGRVRLVFDAFAQRFELSCKVRRLAPGDPMYKATVAHNRLFNPALPAGTEVLGFEPDWS